MSANAGFWAAGSKTVKAAASPTPTITEAPPKPKPMPAAPQKKGLVLKGTNGAADGNGATASTPNGKKTDWADEDEDDNFVAQFTTELKDPRLTSLENTVTVKSERVKELEATVTTKDLRIEMLESAVAEKGDKIADLESVVAENNAKIEQLRKENNEQYIHVQELVGEVDEKDRRIEQLEAEIEEVKETSTMTVTGELQGTTQKETEANDTASETVSAEEFEHVDTAKIASESEESTVDTTETSATTPEKTPPKKDTRSALLKKSDFPTFLTNETLKVVPPAPKPKKLSFPIDLSKYGKNGAAQPATKQVSSPTQGATAPTWGHSSKEARVKTDKVPDFNPSADIRRMSIGERVVYANGPEVIVKMGDAKLATIPKYVLMQCSYKALGYFKEHPNATSWTFPAGSMDVDAAKAHLGWMDEMTYQGRVYSITLNGNPSFDKKNLRICRAARVLGLNNTYVGHFTKQLCDRIRNQDASTEFMDMVCELAYPENDPVFECLANNLVNQSKTKNVKDPAQLEALVAKHANLKENMAGIEKRISSKLRKGGSSREGSKDRTGGAGGAGGRGGKPGAGAVDKPTAVIARRSGGWAGWQTLQRCGGDFDGLDDGRVVDSFVYA
ncbi:hypothetical protein EJ02DRAFT_507269 [Clathrospora elynae]|uniref:Uncharacterized protein n=1 Tax=Clathrospora elynae TaxID=706981 RepID=A0A6A5SC46_9PLEO|nr:hypothetical protein EJ02DRAFT_507269 [Clathrospora elynae]